MRNIKFKVLQTILLIVVIISTSKCMNNKPENTKEVAKEKNEQKFDNKNEKDAQFLVDAAEINREEVRTISPTKRKLKSCKRIKQNDGRSTHKIIGRIN